MTTLTKLNSDLYELEEKLHESERRLAGVELAFRGVLEDILVANARPSSAAEVRRIAVRALEGDGAPADRDARRRAAFERLRRAIEDIEGLVD